jgi:hypothetical protein
MHTKRRAIAANAYTLQADTDALRRRREAEMAESVGRERDGSELQVLQQQLRVLQKQRGQWEAERAGWERERSELMLKIHALLQSSEVLPQREQEREGNRGGEREKERER